MSMLPLVSFVAAAALAQQPQAGYVYPPVVAVGAKTDVQVGGYDLTPDIELRGPDMRVKLEILGPPGEFLVTEPPYWFGPRGRSPASPISREFPARIEVPSEMTPGYARWQMANANGASPTRRFMVSDQPIVLEARHRQESQHIAQLPVIVAGRLGRNAEVDRYSFVTPTAGPVTVDLIARRLSADFHGSLEVWRDDERRIVDIADTEGLDPSAVFVAAAGGRYTVRVFDIDFRGHRSFVYALGIKAGPKVLAVMPAAGRRGSTREVTFIGQGLGPTAEPVSVTRPVTFPANPRSRSFVYQLETPSGTTQVTIPLSDVEEHGSPKRLQNLEVPCAVTSAMGTTRDGDRYRFAAKKGEPWSISVQARAIGSSLDPVLRVLSPDGKEAAANDDAGGSVDCRLAFSSPADGVYTIVVSERSGKGSTRGAIYRLAVERLEAGFELSIPQTLNVAVGGKGELAVKALRTGGYAGEISVAVTGLPAGVSAPSGLKIAGNAAELKIPVTIASDGSTESAYLQVVGVGQIGDSAVARVASAAASGNLGSIDPTSETVTRALLVPTLTSPVTIDVVDKNRQRAVHRGTTYPAPILIARAEGYTGEIALLMASKQGRRRQGISGPVLKVPADATDILYPCFMPEWLSTDRTTRMVILAMAKVTDPKGKDRYLLSTAKSRVTMILEGALLKVAHAEDEIETRLGSELDITAAVKRVPQFREKVTLEAIFPDDVKEHLKSEAVVVPGDQENGVLRITVPTNESLLGEHKVILRATALQNGKWPVVSQASVVVVLSP